MNTTTKGILLAILASAALASANVSAKYFLHYTNAESLPSA